MAVVSTCPMAAQLLRLPRTLAASSAAAGLLPLPKRYIACTLCMAAVLVQLSVRPCCPRLAAVSAWPPPTGAATSSSSTTVRAARCLAPAASPSTLPAATALQQCPPAAHYPPALPTVSTHTLRAGYSEGCAGLATSQMHSSPSAAPEASRLGLKGLNSRPFTCRQGGTQGKN